MTPKQEERVRNKIKLGKLLATEKFIALTLTFLDIYKRLEHEHDISAIRVLSQQADQLEDEL